MIQKIFPYQLQLHILQLEEYNLTKFITWILSHFTTRTIENKKPLVWTIKAKILFFLAIALSVVTIAFFTYFFQLTGFIVGIILATQAYIYLVLALCLFSPFEGIQKARIKAKAEQKIRSLSHLKVIGITGSYGKTSTKEFLYQMLRTKYTVLKTPESYNTPYGIAKVIDLELDRSYEYFICEMGAYRRGEIKEICDMVHPTYGIVTGINEQHIETFGSLKNTIKGKFELLDSLPQDGFCVVNGDNDYIRNAITDYKNITPYGFSDETFSMRKTKQTPTGSTFILLLDGKSYHGQTTLLGKPNLQNMLAAATMSYLLGMKPQTILDAIKNLQPVPHRLEIKKFDDMTIIDDAYNSNVDGFKEAISLLKSFKTPTICVTPGIVDLGEKTFSIHKELGQLLNDIDHVILIGKSERTKGLKEGIENKNKIIELSSIKDVWGEIAELKLKHPTVLLENDLPDNY